MGAVGEDLAVELLGEDAPRAGEVGGVFGQRHGGGDEALDGGERASVEFLGGQGGGEDAGVGDQAGHQALAEGVIGGGGEEVVMAEPGGDAGADDVRAVGDAVGLGLGDPVGDQGAGAHAGGVGAEGVQVAQPGEAVGAGTQDGVCRRGGEGAGAERDAAAGRDELAAHDDAALFEVAEPGVADGLGRGIRHAGHAQAGEFCQLTAGVAEPGTGGLHAGKLRRAVMAAG